MRCFTAILCLLVIITSGLSSCKKGCTNKSAINYDSTAKADDASCLFCDSVDVDEYSSSTFYTDNNSSSPHSGDSVIRVQVSGSLQDYIGNYCPALGLEGGCDTLGTSFPFAHINIIVNNLTDDTLVLFATSSSVFISGSGTTQLGAISQLQIPPYSSKVSHTLYFDCVQASFASSSFSLSGRSFTYK